MIPSKPFLPTHFIQQIPTFLREKWKKTPKRTKLEIKNNKRDHYTFYCKALQILRDKEKHYFQSRIIRRIQDQQWQRNENGARGWLHFPSFRSNFNSEKFIQEMCLLEPLLQKLVYHHLAIYSDFWLIPNIALDFAKLAKYKITSLDQARNRWIEYSKYYNVENFQDFLKYHTEGKWEFDKMLNWWFHKLARGCTAGTVTGYIYALLRFLPRWKKKYESTLKIFLDGIKTWESDIEHGAKTLPILDMHLIILQAYKLARIKQNNIPLSWAYMIHLSCIFALRYGETESLLWEDITWGSMQDNTQGFNHFCKGAKILIRDAKTGGQFKTQSIIIPERKSKSDESSFWCPVKLLTEMRKNLKSTNTVFLYGTKNYLNPRLFFSKICALHGQKLMKKFPHIKKNEYDSISWQSLRATQIAFLKNCKWINEDIMAITRHTTETSLNYYFQKRKQIGISSDPTKKTKTTLRNYLNGTLNFEKFTKTTSQEIEHFLLKYLPIHVEKDHTHTSKIKKPKVISYWSELDKELKQTNLQQQRLWYQNKILLQQIHNKNMNLHHIQGSPT